MGKVLLMTGASSDIGIELIQKMADNYEIIMAHYNHSAENLLSIKETLGDKLILLQADFSKNEDVEGLISQINASGYCPDHIIHLPAQKIFHRKFNKCGWDEYQSGIDISLRSIVLLLQEYLPAMAKRKYGKVVFMLTSCVLNMPPKYQASYVTVKYAMLGLMKSLSVEYADKGITVNGISPDMIETKFLSEVPELIVQKNAMDSPLGRNLTVQDVVPAFEYLLSDAADTVTGQNLGITGGM